MQTITLETLIERIRDGATFALESLPERMQMTNAFFPVLMPKNALYGTDGRFYDWTLVSGDLFEREWDLDTFVRKIRPDSGAAVEQPEYQFDPVIDYPEDATCWLVYGQLHVPEQVEIAWFLPGSNETWIGYTRTDPTEIDGIDGSIPVSVSI